MGRIYERATRVVAWIGRELTAPDSEEDRINSLCDASAIKFINLIFGDIEHNRYFRKSRWFSHDADGLQLWQNSHTELYNIATDSDWANLLRLCQRRYWSRLWIIQELVLARSIVIQLGSFLLGWEALEHFFFQSRLPEDPDLVKFRGDAVQTLSGLRNSVPFKIYLQRNEKFGAGISPALFDLFYLHRDAQCLQVQDKLFGLLGMSAECCQLAILPDYEIPLSTLCRVFLVHHLQQHAGHTTRNKVPHWTCGLHQALMLFSVDSLNGGRMVSGSSISMHLYKPSSASFSVPCFFRGPLSRTFSVAPSKDISIGSIGDLGSAAANAFLERAHQVQLGRKCPDIAALSSQYTDIRELINSISAPGDNREASTITHSIRRSLENALESSLGEIVISIGEMQAGDSVFDLGDQVLFVLRPISSGLKVVGIGAALDLANSWGGLPRLPTRQFMDRLWVEDWTLSENCELWEALSEVPEYFKKQFKIAVSNVMSSKTEGQRLARRWRAEGTINNPNRDERRRGS
jgi:hypothetical protein